MEVLEEEEIAALKEQQRKFLELRAMEKAETRRLEEQERRLREEKVRESLESLFFSKCIKNIYTSTGSTIETIRRLDDRSKGNGRTDCSGHPVNRIYSRTSSSCSRRIENVRFPIGRDQGWFVNTQEHCYFL